MLLGRPVRPARHPVWVNVASGACCECIGVGEEVGVHIDELLGGVGVGTMPRVSVPRLDIHAAPPLDVLQQLPREFLPFEEPRGLKRGRRACQWVGVG